MSKWRFNGIEIDVNPTFVSKRPSKHVSYRTTIDGKEVRVLPFAQQCRDVYRGALATSFRRMEEQVSRLERC
jgi:hypothetical protein